MKSDINAYTTFKKCVRSLLCSHYLEVIVYGVSNHCSSFEDVSDLPLHSLHLLSCGGELNSAPPQVKAILENMVSVALLYGYRNSPFLMSCGRMPLTAVL